MSDTIMNQLSTAVSDPANKDTIKKINGVFQFTLSSPNSEWTVDFKEGKVTKGKAPKSDVQLTMKDGDFVDLMTGKANGQQMFMSGKIKFKGNMGMLMKMGELQKIAA